MKHLRDFRASRALRVLGGFTALSLCLCTSSAASGESRTPGAITALAFGPDGKKLAVGMFGQVALYETTTWQRASRTTAVEDTVRTLAFRPGSQVLAIGSGLPGRSGRVTVWDTASSAPPRSFAIQADAIEAVAWDRSGALLIGSDDNKARVLTSPTSAQGAVLDDHNGRVLSAAFSPREGSIFATGGLDKMVKIWDYETHRAVVNFDQSEAGMTGLAFLPNGTTVIGGSLDGRLYWWTINHNAAKHEYTGSRVRSQDAHAGGVNALAISEDGKRMVTGGEDRIVRIWDPVSGRMLKTFADSPQPIYAVAISPDGRIAAGAGREGRAYVWSVDDGRLTAIVAPEGLPAPQAAKPARRGAKG